MRKRTGKLMLSILALCIAGIITIYGIVIVNWQAVAQGLLGKEIAASQTVDTAELNAKLTEITALKEQIAELQNKPSDSGAEIEALIEQLERLKEQVPDPGDCWVTIGAISEAGLAQEFFQIGDEKSFRLSTYELVTVVVLGFDHDDKSDGSGKAGISFGMKHLLSTAYSMNETHTSTGGWHESLFRTQTIPKLFGQLPSDLRNRIKTVDKVAAAGNSSTNLITSQDALWLLSEVEVRGASGSILQVTTEDGAQYEYWQFFGINSDSYIKKTSNGVGLAGMWYLRSTDIRTTGNNPLSFRCTTTTGNVGAAQGGFLYHPSFGFAI